LFEDHGTEAAIIALLRAQQRWRICHRVSPPAAKMSQHSKNDVAPAPELAFNSPLWPHNPLCVFAGRIESMVIGAVLFIGVVLAAGAAIGTAYERYQDVLYGPYLKPMD
jgi:hypothetical protein